MRPEPNATLVLPTELVGRHQVAVHGLEDNLVPGGSVLGQVDSGVPTLPYQLDQIVLRMNVNLKVNILVSTNCALVCVGWDLHSLNVPRIPLRSAQIELS